MEMLILQESLEILKKFNKEDTGAKSKDIVRDCYRALKLLDTFVQNEGGNLSSVCKQNCYYHEKVELLVRFNIFDEILITIGLILKR